MKNLTGNFKEIEKTLITLKVGDVLFIKSNVEILIKNKNTQKELKLKAKKTRLVKNIFNEVFIVTEKDVESILPIRRVEVGINKYHKSKASIYLENKSREIEIRFNSMIKIELREYNLETI